LLVGLDHKLRPFGGRLILADSSKDVSRILELSGLVSVAASITMSPTVESALEGLQLPKTVTEQLWEKSFEMPIDVNQLSPTREQVCSELRPLGFPESSLFDMKVALGEALANALRHGVIKPDEGEIRVRVAAYDDRVIIEVQDNGPGFDGNHAAEHDLYAPSGRGVMFMQALMDRVEFERVDTGGTLVRLVKHRPGRA
jgi:serine/threonine-protein kinase RsbW